MRLRPFAVVLRVAREHLLGGAAADLPGVAGRDRARIDRVEVAPGRQHVEPAARRRAGRARRHERPPSAREQPERSRRRRRRPRARAERLERIAASSSSSGSEAVRALGRAAEHMQPVADAHVLEVAEPGVELRPAPSSGGLPSAAHSCEQARFAPRARGSASAMARARRGSSACASANSSNRPSSSSAAPCDACGDQRRRQMADRHRADAALGLRRLARIVDDERDRRPASAPSSDFGRASLATARPPCRATIRACRARRAGSSRRLARLAAARNRTRHRRGAAAGRDRDSRPCG